MFPNAFYTIHIDPIPIPRLASFPVFFFRRKYTREERLSDWGSTTQTPQRGPQRIYKIEKSIYYAKINRGN